MRAFAYDILTAPVDAAALHALVPPTRINTSGAGQPTPPFIVIRSRIVTAPFEGRTTNGGMTIHVHDKPESYKKIDDIMDIINDLIMNSVPRHWRSRWVSSVENLGWSEDLFDDHYGTATRFGTYALHASA